jgi:hypothetical protein
MPRASCKGLATERDLHGLARLSMFALAHERLAFDMPFP